MKTRITTGIIFAVVMLAFTLPAIRLPWLTAAFLGLICLMCALEYTQALRRVERNVPVFFSLLSAVLMYSPLVIWLIYRKLRPGWLLITKKDAEIAPYWSTDMLWLVFLGLGIFLLLAFVYTLVCLLIRVLGKGTGAVISTFTGLSIIPLIVFPFSCALLFLFAVPNGFRWLALAFLASWVTDIAAYYAGSYFGNRKFLAGISPHKTFEGFIGGVLGCLIFCLLYFIIFMHGADPLRSGFGQACLYGLLSGLVIGLVSQLGDWLMSAVKRLADIKDFSKLLPGHGGVLDRFDSVLISFPATLIISIFYTVAR